MSIQFTQYLLPFGRKQLVEISRSAEVEDIAQRFIASGGRYECEALRTGQVSFTAVKAFNGLPENDVAIELSTNEPGAPGIAVDKLGSPALPGVADAKEKIAAAVTRLGQGPRK